MSSAILYVFKLFCNSVNLMAWPFCWSGLCKQKQNGTSKIDVENKCFM